MGNAETQCCHAQRDWREPQAFLYAQKIHAMVRVIETAAAAGPMAIEYTREVYNTLRLMEEDGRLGGEDLANLWECAEPIRRRLPVPLCVATGTTEVYSWQTSKPLPTVAYGYDGEDENNAKRARHY